MRSCAVCRSVDRSRRRRQTAFGATIRLRIMRGGEFLLRPPSSKSTLADIFHPHRVVLVVVLGLHHEQANHMARGEHAHFTPGQPVRVSPCRQCAVVRLRYRERATSVSMIVCTLCSCYPWSVLGLPPVWYKSAPYRSRAVIDPRGVLEEFGVDAAGRHQNPRVGIDRRDPLPGGAAAARPAPRAGARRSSPSWSRANG